MSRQFAHSLLITCLLAICGTGAQALDLFTNGAIPGNEKTGMQVLYTLGIPGANPAYRNATPVPYSTDNSGSIPIGSYSRIGYYVEVTSGTQAGEFVYISMDQFDTNPARLGLPHNLNNPVARQTIVNNANIFSDNASIVTGTGVGTVNLEMWSTNYATGPGATIPGGANNFDFDDSGFGIGTGHGSFQIHNHGAGALQTLFGWSDWGGNGAGLSEFGIGNATLLGEPHPDWTFSDRGQTGFLQILVGNYFDMQLTAQSGPIDPITTPVTTVPGAISTSGLDTAQVSEAVNAFPDPGNPIDLTFSVVGVPSNGVVEIAIDKEVINQSGIDMESLTMQLLDLAGNPSTATFTNSTQEDNGEFLDVAVNANEVEFSNGELLGDGSETAAFHLEISIPGPNGTDPTTGLPSFDFVLRQFTAAVPEPHSIAIWTLLGLALTAFGYYRARRNK